MLLFTWAILWVPPLRIFVLVNADSLPCLFLSVKQETENSDDYFSSRKMKCLRRQIADFKTNLVQSGKTCYSLTSSQNPASRHANTSEHVVCIPSRKQVHPPISSQFSWRSLAACLKTATSETLVTRVPSAGIGLPLSLVQLDNNSTLTSNAARIKSVRFTILSPFF